MGEVDLATIPILRAAVDELLRDDPDVALLDLSGVGFMDSSGLALLVESARRTPRLGVVNPSHSVRRLIVLSGLETILKMAP